MKHRQPRTYPLLGVLLANLFTSVVLAKLAPLSASPYSYDSDPWLAYNGPARPEYHSPYFYPTPSSWNPIQPFQTYAPPPLYATVSLTTSYPEIDNHQHLSDTSGYQTNNANQYYQNVDYHSGQIEPNANINSIYNNEIAKSETISNKIDLDLIASGTNNIAQKHQGVNNNKTHVKRATYSPNYTYKRRQQNRVVTPRYKRYKNSQKRKYHTTTPSYYYDSYEDMTTRRYKPRTQTRPSYAKRTTTEVYDEYEESYEATTRPYRIRRPMRNKNKKRPPYEDEYNDDEDKMYDDYDETRETFTETIMLKPRQKATTESITTTMTTTTSSSSDSINTTTPGSANTTMNTTLYGKGSGNDNISISHSPPGNDYFYPSFTGYGPSNGNENISITYGPPTRLEYASPYINWYTQQARTNDVIKRVQDIIGFDDDTFRQRLT